MLPSSPAVLVESRDTEELFMAVEAPVSMIEGRVTMDEIGAALIRRVCD